MIILKLIGFIILAILGVVLFIGFIWSLFKIVTGLFGFMFYLGSKAIFFITCVVIFLMLLIINGYWKF